MKSILENRPGLAKEVNKVADGLNVTVVISLLISQSL